MPKRLVSKTVHDELLQRLNELWQSKGVSTISVEQAEASLAAAQKELGELPPSSNTNEWIDLHLNSVHAYDALRAQLYRRRDDVQEILACIAYLTTQLKDKNYFASIRSTYEQELMAIDDAIACSERTTALNDYISNAIREAEAKVASATYLVERARAHLAEHLAAKTTHEDAVATFLNGYIVGS